MPPRTKANKSRIANLKPPPHFAPVQNPTPEKLLKINGKLLAFATIVHGGSYEQVSDIFRQAGIDVVERSAFDTAQRKVLNAIIEMGQESMTKWREKLEPNTIICLDGNYDHKRDGKHCLVGAIDNHNWKIIDIEILERAPDSMTEEEAKAAGLHSESSATMENECAKKLIPRLKLLADKIVGYCHDNDHKLRKVFKDNDWDITEFLDTNHAMLSFSKSFENINVQHDKVMSGLYYKLKLWAYHVIFMPVSTEEKVERFLNAANHYTGDHRKCDHPEEHEEYITPTIDDPKVKVALEQFLQENKYIVEYCLPIANTQHNESFHNTRARMALKHIAWKESYVGRTMAAVLDVNEFDRDWRSELREKLGLPPLHPKIQQHFDKKLKEKIERAAKKRTLEYQSAEKTRRLLHKKKYAKLCSQIGSYNIEHIPKYFEYEDDSEAYLYIQRLPEGSFKTFLKDEYNKEMSKNLRQFAKSFIRYPAFQHRNYIKEFISFCQVFYTPSVQQIVEVYDKTLLHEYETQYTETDFAQEMINLWNLPNLITAKARENLPEDIPDPPEQIVEFRISKIYIDGVASRHLVFPYCKDTQNATSKLEGVIIHKDEAKYYPPQDVLPISGTNLRLVMKAPITRSVYYNCDIVLRKCGDCVAAYIKKASKVLNPATKRKKTVKVKSGQYATVADMLF